MVTTCRLLTESGGEFRSLESLTGVPVARVEMNAANASDLCRESILIREQ